MIEAPFQNYLSSEAIDEIRLRIINAYDMSTLTRDELLGMRTDIETLIDVDFITIMSNVRNDFYIISGVFAVVFIIIAFIIKRSGKSKVKSVKEKGKFLVKR